MLCFEVWINGKRIKTVGYETAEEFGVSFSAYPSLNSDSAALEMTGYASSEHLYSDELRWGLTELRTGDEVLIKLITAEDADPPLKARYAEGQASDAKQAMICSNCGKSHFEVEHMVTANRIVLCGDCCQEIVDFVKDND